MTVSFSEGKNKEIPYEYATLLITHTSMFIIRIYQAKEKPAIFMLCLTQK